MWTSASSLTCLRVAKYHKAEFKTTEECFSEMLLENNFSRQMLVLLQGNISEHKWLGRLPEQSLPNV